jgi:hypothetical protein
VRVLMAIDVADGNACLAYAANLRIELGADFCQGDRTAQ